MLDEATFFESAHTAAAQAGQSAVPTDLDVDTHFIAFIEAVNSQGYVDLSSCTDHQREEGRRAGWGTRGSIRPRTMY